MKNAVKKIIAFVLAVMICISTAGFTTRSGASPWDGEGSAAVDSLRNYYSSVFVTGLDGRINEMLVNVKAMQGTFPDSAMLSVTPVPAYESGEIDAAVGEERARGALVAASYTFDIKMVDENGVEYQPTDGRDVYISFSMDQIANENLDTQVYHIEGSGDTLAAEPLYTQTQNDTATVATGGFSYYTVEFTYGELCYVLQGGEAVPLSEILSYVGIYGEIEAAYGSNDALFSISNEGGIWTVTSHEAFDTTEWLRVTVGGVEYEIVVTDDNTSQNVPVPDPNNPNQPFYSGTVETYWDNTASMNNDPISNPNSTSNSLVKATDNLVKQSQSTTSCTDFAAGLPLSTIFIETAKVKGAGTVTLLTEDESIAGGFVLDGQPLVNLPNKSGIGALVEYDPTRSTSSAPLKQVSANTLTELNGDLFQIVFADAAILQNGSRADLKITYSNAKIAADQRLVVTNENYDGRIGLANGSSISYRGTSTKTFTDTGTGSTQDKVNIVAGKYGSSFSNSNIRTPMLGHAMDAKYQIVDKSGRPVDGTFIFAMAGINLDRDPYRSGGNNYGKPLWYYETYDGNDSDDEPDYPGYHFFSEAVTITNGQQSDYIYVRPNSNIVEDNPSTEKGNKAYYYPQVILENGNVKFIANGAGTNDNIAQGNNQSYSSGFVLLADAAKGLTITAIGHGGTGNTGMDTQVFSAKQIWYRYTHSTGPNGNIQTTSEGNFGGTLNDGNDSYDPNAYDPADPATHVGKSNILDPNTYVVPEGKTVTYTMTPDPGYQIAKLFVNGNEIKFDGKALSAMNPGDECRFRDAANQICTLKALDGGKFTLEMPYAQHDEAVRVQWERTAAEVTVKKETVNNKTGSFPFKIRAWKVENVTSYNINTDPQGNAIDIGSVWFEEGVYKKSGNSTYTADELQTRTRAIRLNEKVEISGTGGKFLWKTDKKLSYLGLITDPADDDDLFVSWLNAANAIVGDTLESVVGIEGIYFYDPNTTIIPNVKTYWDFDTKEGVSTDPGWYSFDLSNGGETTFNIPQKYQYEVYEDTPTGWELLNVKTQRTAHPGGSTVTYNDTVEGANKSGGLLTEENGTTPVHTYTNRKLPSLTVKKQTYNGDGTFEFKVKFTSPEVDEQKYENIPVTATVAFDSEGKKTISYEITNSGAAFAVDVDGIAIPKGSSNYGVSDGLDGVFNKLLAMTDVQSQSIKLGTENGTVSTDATQSLKTWADAQVLDTTQTLPYSLTQTATFTFTSPAKPARHDVLPANFPNVSYNSTDGTYTFSLTTPTNGSFYFPNLPHDTAYEVSETTPGGRWQLWNQDNISGTLTGDATATFTNRQKPSLTITKTVTGTNPDPNDIFYFKLFLEDANNNIITLNTAPVGSPQTVRDSWNAASYYHEFGLKDGESLTIPNLPIGTNVGVIEIELVNEDYETTMKINGTESGVDQGGAWGDDFVLDADTNVEFINRKRDMNVKVYLTCEKMFTSNTWSSEEFSFRIEPTAGYQNNLADNQLAPAHNGETVTVDIFPGYRNFFRFPLMVFETIKDQQGNVLYDTTAGVHYYTLKEIPGTNPDIKYDERTFLLEIQILAPSSPTAAESIGYTMKMYVNGSTTPELIQFSSHQITWAQAWALANDPNETTVTMEMLRKTVWDTPDASYMYDSDLDEWHKLVWSTNTETVIDPADIPDNATGYLKTQIQVPGEELRLPVAARFLNRPQDATLSLAIKKTVTGVGSTTDYFDFTLDLTDAQGNNIENLPAPYLLDANGNPTGEKVKDWAWDVDPFYGVHSFKLKHGEWFRIDGLPVGASYNLTEMAQGLYTPTFNITGDQYTDDIGTPIPIGDSDSELLITALWDNYLFEDTTVEFVNKGEPEQLTISKTVTGYGDKTRDWNFTVTLMDQNGDPITNVSEPNGATNWDDSGKSNGVYKFTLKHGESLTIPSPIPANASGAGVYFTVSEEVDPSDGYTTTCDYSTFGAPTQFDIPAEYLSQSPIPIVGDTVVAFKNDKQTLNLKIGKTVAGNMGDKTREFEFMITLDKPDPNDPGTMVPINGLPAPSGATDWVELGYGAYSFKLKHGDSFTILGLPHGTTYYVVELQPLDGHYDTTIDVDKKSTTYHSDAYVFYPPQQTENPEPPTYIAFVTDVMNEDVKITYTNTKGSTPPTGIYDSLGPALAGFVTATMLLAVSRLGRRRRRNE